jgi:glutamate racemase
MSSAPIGVFDSGVGGLSILAPIHELLPAENLLYLADSLHAPYGPRGEAYIRERADRIMQFFLQQQVKAVVVACNTATAAAITWLRERYPIPIIGVEPAVKPAAELSNRGIVGVLATSGTLASDKYITLHNRFTHQVEIITRACPGLVELIEQPELNETAIRGLLAEFTEPMLDKGADTLVLGCTHYSLITEIIQSVVGPQVRIVDSGKAVARQLQRKLEHALAEGSAGGISFFSTGEPDQQGLLMRRYWGTNVRVLNPSGLL